MCRLPQARAARGGRCPRSTNRWSGVGAGLRSMAACRWSPTRRRAGRAGRGLVRSDQFDSELEHVGRDRLAEVGCLHPCEQSPGRVGVELHDAAEELAFGVNDDGSHRSPFERRNRVSGRRGPAIGGWRGGRERRRCRRGVRRGACGRCRRSVGRAGWRAGSASGNAPRRDRSGTPDRGRRRTTRCNRERQRSSRVGAGREGVQRMPPGLFWARSAHASRC